MRYRNEDRQRSAVPPTTPPWHPISPQIRRFGSLGKLRASPGAKNTLNTCAFTLIHCLEIRLEILEHFVSRTENIR